MDAITVRLRSLPDVDFGFPSIEVVIVSLYTVEPRAKLFPMDSIEEDIVAVFAEITRSQCTITNISVPEIEIAKEPQDTDAITSATSTVAPAAATGHAFVITAADAASSATASTGKTVLKQFAGNSHHL